MLQRIDPPKRKMTIDPDQPPQWYTWTDTFVKDISSLKKEFDKVDVRLVHFADNTEYNYTYSIDPDAFSASTLAYFEASARELCRLNPSQHLFFFTNLISRQISNKNFQKIFCLLRNSIIKLRDQGNQALYAPLNGGKHQSNFPLHCDLYIPKILWNIYGQVPADGSGRTLLLKVRQIFAALESIPSVPPATVKRLRQLIAQQDATDNFNEFYKLLHDPANKWHKDFVRDTKKLQSTILFSRGEGYMIHDRIWMHGRDHTSGGISRKRLHRLIFNNDHC